LRRLLASVVIVAVLAVMPVLTETADAAGYNPFYWGQCTWYAYNMRPDLAGHLWGNASNWPYAARVSGDAVGTSPRAGALVVFQPGVQGAWGTGHVAYVTAVGSNGWFQVSETDYPYPGQVTYRWAQSGWGVTFID